MTYLTTDDIPVILKADLAELWSMYLLEDADQNDQDYQKVKWGFNTNNTPDIHIKWIIQNKLREDYKRNLIHIAGHKHGKLTAYEDERDVREKHIRQYLIQQARPNSPIEARTKR